MTNFIFNYSISTQPYDRNKDVNKTNSLMWIEINSNVDEFINDIKNESAFCPCFYHDSNTFSNKSKSEINFKSSSFITFDFDAVKHDINTFYNILKSTEICPNLIYTTANNGHFKEGKNEVYNNRYRTIYFVDNPITNVSIYKSIHHALKNEIFIYVEDDNIFNDNTDISPSHFFAGNQYAKIIQSENEVYNLQWLLNRYNITGDIIPTSINKDNNKSINQIYNIERLTGKNDNGYILKLIINKINNIYNKSINQLYNKKEKEEKKSIIRLIDTFSEIENDEFVKDYYNIDFKTILAKYSGGDFVNRMVTPLEQPANGLIIELPDEYVEIRRFYNYQPATGYTIPKLRNGEGRRKKLYQNLLLRKRITPNITLQNLLFNAIYEMVYYIDNTDKNDIITKRQIAQIVVNAYFDDCTIIDIKKPNYKINKEYCKLNGIKAQQANIKYINKLRTNEKKKRCEDILKFYDIQKSDKDNLQILNDNGVNISMATLKRYKKENGITKYKKTQHHANSCDLSVSICNMDKNCPHQ